MVFVQDTLFFAICQVVGVFIIENKLIRLLVARDDIFDTIRYEVDLSCPALPTNSSVNFLPILVHTTA